MRDVSKCNESGSGVGKGWEIKKEEKGGEQKEKEEEEVEREKIFHLLRN